VAFNNFNFSVQNSKKKESLWMSSVINNLLAILYLYNKHKNMCEPVLYKEVSWDLQKNQKGYTSYSKKAKKSNKLKPKFSLEITGYSDFEIMWRPRDYDLHVSYDWSIKEIQENYDLEFIYSNLSLGFFHHLKKCKSSGKRLLICPLYLAWGTDNKNEKEGGGAHANMIIFDMVKQTCERFEPYGLQFDHFANVSNNNLDNVLKNIWENKIEYAFDLSIKQFFKKHKINYKYIEPNNFCPTKSFQFYNNIIENSNTYKQDPPGFCAVWSILWADLRLTYPDIPQKKLLNDFKKKIEDSDLLFKQFIRNYANFIQKNRNVLLKNLNVSEKLIKQLTKKTQTTKTEMKEFTKDYLNNIFHN